ncbi:helix-turn-helix domain-containing protein [Pedobacter borealis]|uniref:helix-turn-helix domain-containing protein n=1 Tax=Pedobacter borealis TaxID=475254 RepID=UPI0004930DB6|nr:helix-turn-helix domain-containing protein [Pedobacter borealis]
MKNIILLLIIITATTHFLKAEDEHQLWLRHTSSRGRFSCFHLFLILKITGRTARNSLSGIYLSLLRACLKIKQNYFVCQSERNRRPFQRINKAPASSAFGRGPLAKYVCIDQALKKRIYNYIWSNSYLKMVTLEDIACNFNPSPHTLQRKLKSEEINFQQLTDEARKNLALMYLKDDSLQIKEISTTLGYNEVSAFKRWTGTAPTGYQKKMSLS